MTTLYLVRHGQTDSNAEGRIQGHRNSTLTLAGISQAWELSREFETIHFDAAYASDLSRAHETAKILVSERELAVKTTQALRERSLGILEGRLRSEVQDDLDALWAIHNALPEDERWQDALVQGAESDEQIMSRFITFLREVAVAHPDETVLIVSHGSIIRTFLVHLGLFTADQMRSGSMKNAGYIVVKSDGIDFMVEKIVGVETAGTDSRD